ncbi:MAG: delta-60 repeat domain-containing protein [Verrucomicrobiales bacterium]|nr:delta-60 repeat domain-containing protein [Verrucomicrobiales bacterium]
MTPSYCRYFAGWIWLCVTLISSADPGELDPEFDSGRLEPASGELAVTTGLVRANGDVILARSAYGITEYGDLRLLRLLPDGRRDYSFAQDTNLVFVHSPSLVVELAGGPLLFGGGIKPSLLAVTPMGRRDPSFALHSSLRHLRISAVARVPDGSFLLGASSFSSTLSSYPLVVARVAPTGVPDPSFKCSLAPTGSVTALRSLDGGSVLVAGWMTDPASGASGTLFRLHADGTVDTSFEVPPSIVGRRILGGIDLPDGDWIALVSDEPEGADTMMIRLRGDGSVAPGYETWVGRPGIGRVRTVIPDGDGYLVGGSGLLRLGADGLPDPSAVLPKLTNSGDFFSVLLRLPDQSVVAGGSFDRIQTPGQGLVLRPSYLRFTPGGMVDVNYGRTGLTQDLEGTLAPDRIEVIPLRDGGVVTFGSGRHANGSATGAIARWGPQGALDTNFPPGRIRSSGITGVMELPGGGWLIGLRSPLAVEDAPAASLLIIDAAGRVSPLTEALGFIQAMALCSDGSVLVAGDFEPISPRGVPELRRITMSGTVDPQFDPGLGFTPSVRRPGMLMGLHADDRIVVGVRETGEIRRFLKDGSVDPQFESTPPMEGPGEHLASLVVMEDDSIVAVGGSLKSPRGETSIVIRWKPDGTRDRDFHSSLRGAPSKVAAAGSGRFLMLGNIYESNRPSKGLYRCFPNGAIDPSFEMPSNLRPFNGLASQGRWAYALASLKRRTPSTLADIGLVRFDNDVRPLANPEPTPAGIRLRLVAPSGESHRVEASDDLEVWSPVGAFVMPPDHRMEWTVPTQLSGPRQFFRDTRLD